ncbi:trypco2 family protein [Kocuria rosea]|uniref:Trypsin-co-occurring domain-containing protein n=1 Tax=Kocuria rosea TaxID=1275 RepID=A0A4R5Y1X8_KOCRO|nr:trypco2 family protein [Kocuria rosea]TDL37477.1 hypothetical protein E2R59_17940 [Kocuria rosea]
MAGEKWPDGLIPLTSLVAALRAELKQAKDSADPSMPFVVGPVTVEVNVVVRYEAEAKFGAKLWAFLDAGVGAKASRETGHKLTFTLTPTDPTSPTGDVHIEDQVVERPPLMDPRKHPPSAPSATSGE